MRKPRRDSSPLAAPAWFQIAEHRICRIADPKPVTVRSILQRVVGQGRTHRLSGIGIIEAAEVEMYDRNDAWLDGSIDMTGHIVRRRGALMMHAATEKPDSVSADNRSTGWKERERGGENAGVVPFRTELAHLWGSTTANSDRRSFLDCQFEDDWRSRGYTREVWDARQYEPRDKWRRIDVEHRNNLPGAGFCYGVESVSLSPR